MPQPHTRLRSKAGILDFPIRLFPLRCPGVSVSLGWSPSLLGLASISPLFPSSRNDALELVKWPWTGAGPQSLSSAALKIVLPLRKQIWRENWLPGIAPQGVYPELHAAFLQT